MEALQILEAMKKQYDDDLTDRAVFGSELVPREQLMGERRMIILVEKLIKAEIDKMVDNMETQHD